MSSLLSATKISGANAELSMNNEEHRDDIEKLLHLIELLKSTSGDFIIELHISPMSLIQDRLSEVKKFEFYIIYNNSYTDEEVSSMKEDCSEFIKALINDEFPDIEPVSKINYYTSWHWTEPTLCLYSLLGKPRWEDISEPAKAWIREICCEMGLALSISYHSVNSRAKCLFLHFREATDRILFERNFNLFKERFNLELSEKSCKANNIYYVPIIGMRPIQYELPYEYIDKNTEYLQENFTQFEE